MRSVSKISSEKSLRQLPIVWLLCLAVLLLGACRTVVPTPETTPATSEATPSSRVEPARTPAVIAETKATPPPAPAGEATVPDEIRILLKTSKGDIEASLFADRAPVTVANFLNLAQRGFYDGLTFHRVIPNFMIQGGDPLGTGAGGPGYRFEDEFDRTLQHAREGVLSMANAGPNTNGSQFFITHQATPWLDGRHTVFGQVTNGMRVVNTIRKDDTIRSIEILDAPDALFQKQAERIARWNAALEASGF